MLVLLVVLTATLSSVALAQRPDTLRRDSIVPRLPVVEVTRSILPIAGPAIGSAVPARMSILASDEIVQRRRFGGSGDGS